MTHTNAILTHTGRTMLAELVVIKHWPLRRAGERFGVSSTTAKRWADKYRLYGPAGMQDTSSRPKHCPNRLSQRLERRIVCMRAAYRFGPARIAYRLGLTPSTVWKVLRRYKCPPLRWTDPATGSRIKTSRAESHRYERNGCGELIHVDIKKLGRIPDGGGRRIHGPEKGAKKRTGSPENRRPGWAYLHNAIDDYSRLAYSEILTDEKAETAAGFWKRASAWFASHGMSIERVMTDNGACYRSRVFRECLGEGVKHKRTRPYHPQTNGKVERWNRILLEEWAYAKAYNSEQERVEAFAGWLEYYNTRRGHSALKGQPPISRVTNLRG